MHARGAIFDAEGKRVALLSHAEALGVGSDAAIAVGDGANDIPMIREAGLGVGFHPKKALPDAADSSIEFGGFEVLVNAFDEALEGVPVTIF